MQAEVKSFFKDSKNEMKDALKKNANPDKLGNAIKNSKGQYLITSCQIDWTNEVEATLDQLEKGTGSASYKKLRNIFKIKVEKYTNFIKKLSDDVRSRNKLVALITIEQHNKDIIEMLSKKNITSNTAFDWQSQLKVVKESIEGNGSGNGNGNEPPAIVIRQTNCRFEYGNEYQGIEGVLY